MHACICMMSAEIMSKVAPPLNSSLPQGKAHLCPMDLASHHAARPQKWSPYLVSSPVPVRLWIHSRPLSESNSGTCSGLVEDTASTKQASDESSHVASIYMIYKVRTL